MVCGNGSPADKKAGTAHGAWIKLNRFKHPSKTVTWMDALNKGRCGVLPSFYETDNPYASGTAFRHQLSANFLMIAGNVINAKPSMKIGSSTESPYVWDVGWQNNRK